MPSELKKNNYFLNNAFDTINNLDDEKVGGANISMTKNIICDDYDEDQEVD